MSKKEIIEAITKLFLSYRCESTWNTYIDGEIRHEDPLYFRDERCYALYPLTSFGIKESELKGQVGFLSKNDNIVLNLEDKVTYMLDEVNENILMFLYTHLINIEEHYKEMEKIIKKIEESGYFRVNNKFYKLHSTSDMFPSTGIDYDKFHHRFMKTLITVDPKVQVHCLFDFTMKNFPVPCTKEEYIEHMTEIINKQILKYRNKITDLNLVLDMLNS